MSVTRRELLRFIALLAATLLLASIGPLEQVLGGAARVVYLHGAWVWAALVALLAAAAFGLGGLVLRDANLQRWSAGWGRSGAAFWLTSLLLSLWAMQTSWNGLYLAEPRWQLGVRFAVVAVLLQAAAAVIRRPAVACALNAAFFLALAAALLTSESVMHPPAPISGSGWPVVQAFFLALLLTASLAAWQLAAILRPRW